MSELEVLGARCLDLLRDTTTVTVLGLLRERPMSALDIQDAGTGLAWRVALSRLSTLLALGVVEFAEHQASSRALRQAPHQLLTKGRALESVVDRPAIAKTAGPPSPNRPGCAGPRRCSLPPTGRRSRSRERSPTRDCA
jgi:hypothetical protein